MLKCLSEQSPSLAAEAKAGRLCNSQVKPQRGETRREKVTFHYPI